VIPKDVRVACQGDVCCYPSDRKTMICCSNSSYNTVIVYIKIVEITNPN